MVENGLAIDPFSPLKPHKFYGKRTLKMGKLEKKSGLGRRFEHHQIGVQCAFQDIQTRK